MVWDGEKIEELIHFEILERVNDSLRIAIVWNDGNVSGKEIIAISGAFVSAEPTTRQMLAEISGRLAETFKTIHKKVS